MPDLELSLKQVSRATTSRNFLIIVPLVIAGAFSFGYTYYKQANYQHNQPVAQVKTAPSAAGIPLATSKPQPVSSLSVVEPTSSAPLSSGAANVGSSAQAPSSSTPAQAGVNPKVQPNGAGNQLQSNVNTKDSKTLAIPAVQKILGEL